MNWNSFAGQGEPSGGAGGPTKGPKRPKTACLDHKQVWWLQNGGTVWNKGGTSQGTSLVLHWNRFGGQGGPYGCARGPPKRPKRPKTAFFGHKRIWSLQTGGTVWNKGGTSQGTSTVMHWKSFGGQGEPYGCARGPPKRSKTAKNSLFGPTHPPGGHSRPVKRFHCIAPDMP